MSTEPWRWLHVDALMQRRGWMRPAWLAVDGHGRVAAVQAQAPHGNPDVERVRGAVVPGIPNLHSHAFQRAMAGRTERASAEGQDNFWSWRSRMYALAQRLSPEDVQAIAAQLYAEMLCAGFTSVGEFHYLHHGVEGAPYADLAVMGAAILEASVTTGMRATLLPVFYAHGGVNQPPGQHQRRFVSADVEAFQRLLEASQRVVERTPHARLGMAPHSLRAVDRSELRALVTANRTGPIHIHAAEQPAEVDAIRNAWGQRPVEHLVHEQGADARWCLVHATHVTPEEVLALAQSGAVAGLCPTTEANLGDGIFPAAAFLRAGGRMGVGSDSHVVVDAAEELRLLESGQRLTTGTRNVLQNEEGQGHVGRTLMNAVLSSGAQALDQPVGALEVGLGADLLVLDTDHPRLLGARDDALLDAWLMAAGPRSAVRHVMVGGRWVVRDGVHVDGQRVARAYAETLAHLED